MVGLLPTIPGTTLLPNIKTGCAAPWSVPPEAFEMILRPNSEKVIPATLSSNPSNFASSIKAPMASETPFSKFAWVPIVWSFANVKSTFFSILKPFWFWGAYTVAYIDLFKCH